MISFLLCLLFSVSILVVFRLLEKLKIDNLQAILISYFVSALAAFLVSDKDISIVEIPNQDWFYYTFIIGASFFIGFNMFALSTQKAGLALTSVASNISVIIPVSFALLLYGEQLNWGQIIGLIVALIAIVLVFKPANKGKFSLAVMLFPLGLFIISGTNNSLMKHVEYLGAMQKPMLFLGLIFAVAFIISLVFYIFQKNKKPIKLKGVLGAITLGIFNFSSTYFFLSSLNQFESSVFFPIYNLAFIGTAALVGVFVFKEKLKLINWLGLILAIFAIILITYFN